MRNKLENSRFARLYLWTARAKYTMGMFFLIVVIFYLFLGFVSEGPAVTLDFFTALQMACVCLIIGFTRQGIVPNEKLTKSRCILWIGLNTLVMLACSFLFHWFAALPTWCLVAFLAVAVVGMAGILLGHFFELHKETQLLNRQLEKFQRRQTREE